MVIVERSLFPRERYVFNAVILLLYEWRSSLVRSPRPPHSTTNINTYLPSKDFAVRRVAY